MSSLSCDRVALGLLLALSLGIGTAVADAGAAPAQKPCSVLPAAPAAPQDTRSPGAPDVPLEIAPLRTADALGGLPDLPHVVDAEGVLPRIDSRLDRLRSYSARFVQVNRYSAAAFADTFSGQVYARMPNDFLLLYTDPAGQFIRSDGFTLSMYVPENGQLVQGTIARSADEMNFFRLLQDYIHHSDAVVTVDAADPRLRNVVLLPRDHSSLREVRVQVKLGDDLPLRVETVDDNGNHATYELRDAKIDRPLSDAVFSPPLPADVEIVRP
jgi:outer membrane lipoprotein-sorting protein